MFDFKSSCVCVVEDNNNVESNSVLDKIRVLINVFLSAERNAFLFSERYVCQRIADRVF